MNEEGLIRRRIRQNLDKRVHHVNEHTTLMGIKDFSEGRRVLKAMIAEGHISVEHVPFPSERRSPNGRGSGHLPMYRLTELARLKPRLVVSN